MKVGVLGSGEVAQTLAAGCAQHGYEVMIGTRTVSKLADWGKEHPKVRIGSFADTARFGDLVMLAVKGTASAAALREAGVSNLSGKAIVDATNPIADTPPVDGLLQYFTTIDESLMERLQREFPAARFVKAFNSVGADLMVNPKFTGGKPTMFICGNDEAAKKSVGTLLDQFGWEVADMGKCGSARAIEALCQLWCLPGFLSNQWGHAFKMLT